MTSPGSRSVPLVGGARLPLAFIMYGVVAYVAGTTWMAIRPADMLEPYLHPRVVALVHLWLPGFLLSVCIGALYQLMPVVLGTALRADSAALWTHLGLHGTGSSMLVFGFATGRFEVVATGGVLVAVGVVLLSVAVFRTFRAASRRDAAAWSFPLAAGWLLLTVLLGIALALNRRTPFIPLAATSLLRAHAHLGLVGFFLTLLQGVTFQLIPMFTMGVARRTRFIWAGLIGSQIGLLMLAPGFAWGISLLVFAGASFLAGGMVASGVALVATLKQRRRRVLEPGIRAFVTGALVLIVAGGMGGVLITASGYAAWQTRLISVYGLLIIVGALGLCVLGMLCKIVPFLVWMRAYGPQVGRCPVPVATELSSKRMERVWFAGHVAGNALQGLAMLSGSLPVAAIACWVLLGAAVIFLINAIRVLFHLRAPNSRVVKPQPTLSAL